MDNFIARNNHNRANTEFVNRKPSNVHEVDEGVKGQKTSSLNVRDLQVT